MNTKDFKFELKDTFDDSGTFTGLLSVYNVVDLGSDLVEPGAFTKTILESGGKIPMLWQHKSEEPIGELELVDTPEGLFVKGTLDLNVRRAQEAYSAVKKRYVKGLSIGYDIVKKATEKGVRHLRELKLWEGSVVTFPMCQLALISSVKSVDGKKDFSSELADAQTYALRYMMMEALDASIYDALWGDGYNLGQPEKTQAISDSIDQFKESMLAFLPAYFQLMGMKADKQAAKAGRRHSAATVTQIEEAISKLQALLVEDAADTSEEAASTPAPKAANTHDEPEESLHSLREAYTKAVKDIFG